MATKLRSPPSATVLVAIAYFILSSSPAPATSDADADADADASNTFIKAQCRETENPSLCFEILAPHADAVMQDPVNLTLAAAQAALDSVSALASTISKIAASTTDPPEVKELQHTCNEELGYAVDEIQDAMKELEAARGAGPGPASHADEARLHMDTASTNTVSCAEEFDAEEVENAACLTEARKEMRKVLAYADNAYRLAHHFANTPSSFF